MLEALRQARGEVFTSKMHSCSQRGITQTSTGVYRLTFHLPSICAITILETMTQQEAGAQCSEDEHLNEYERRYNSANDENSDTLIETTVISEHLRQQSCSQVMLPWESQEESQMEPGPGSDCFFWFSSLHSSNGFPSVLGAYPNSFWTAKALFLNV